jgi:HEAT repeat protein
MSDFPPLQELIAKLSDPEISGRVAAVAGLAGHGVSALAALASVLRDDDACDIAKVWAITAIGQIGDDRQRTAFRELLIAADSESAIVRWAALHGLGGLRAADAVPVIAKHLADHAEIPNAWFEDDCRVSHAAAEALRRIGTEDALRALAEGTPGAA